MFDFQGSRYVELLARYVIEDNYQDKVYYNENSTAQLIIVKSILKKLIGAYIVFTEEEEVVLHTRGIKVTFFCFKMLSGCPIMKVNREMRFQNSKVLLESILTKRLY